MTYGIEERETGTNGITPVVLVTDMYYLAQTRELVLIYVFKINFYCCKRQNSEISCHTWVNAANVFRRSSENHEFYNVPICRQANRLWIRIGDVGKTMCLETLIMSTKSRVIASSLQLYSAAYTTKSNQRQWEVARLMASHVALDYSMVFTQRTIILWW